MTSTPNGTDRPGTAFADKLASVPADADVAVTSEPTGEVVFPVSGERRWDEGPSNEQVEALAVELEETRNRLLRGAADFDNYRKRIQRERQELLTYANERIFREILPVLDNLERAVAAGQAQCDYVVLYEGVRMVVQQFHALLDTFGVRRVAGRGQPFNPAWHEAMQQVHSDDLPPGSVADELQPGYMFHERLLRPALVAVTSPSSGKRPVAERSAPAAPEWASPAAEKPALTDDVRRPALAELDGHYLDLTLPPEPPPPLPPPVKAAPPEEYDDEDTSPSIALPSFDE